MNNVLQSLSSPEGQSMAEYGAISRYFGAGGGDSSPSWAHRQQCFFFGGEFS